jgi:hypothetical protein
MFGGWWTHVVPTVVVHQSERSLQRAYPESERRMMSPDEWILGITVGPLSDRSKHQSLIYDSILSCEMCLVPSQSLSIIHIFFFSTRSKLVPFRSYITIGVLRGSKSSTKQRSWTQNMNLRTSPLRIIGNWYSFQHIEMLSVMPSACANLRSV